MVVQASNKPTAILLALLSAKLEERGRVIETQTERLDNKRWAVTVVSAREEHP